MADKIGKWLKEAQQHSAVGHLEEAEALCRKILDIAPDHAGALLELGRVLYYRREHSESVEALEAVLQQEPANVDARILLIYGHVEGGDRARGLALAHEARERSDNPGELLAAYVAFDMMCDWEHTKEMQARILDLAAQGRISSALMPSLLMVLNAAQGIDPARMFELHRVWGEGKEREAQKHRKLPDTFHPSKDGRLKIGYLSADFYQHPVGHFIQNPISHHDRDRFEVYCYAILPVDDARTDCIREAADHFVDVTQLSPYEIARRIHEDGIHILIELGGHTGLSRLETLVFRPAPVQMTYLGYPNTTGLSTVDFRITDAFAEDVEHGTQYVEELLYMPQSFLCAAEFMQDVPRIETTPATKNGYITFGSFNHVRKLNPETIALWSRILHGVEGSRLLIKATGCGIPIVRDNILAAFAHHGIDADRIRFHGAMLRHTEHAAIFNEVDIALDAFPYNGTTTTCETLWMGVPVVTLVGNQHVQRTSYSILKNIGLDATIAHTPDEYVEKAINLSRSIDNLNVLRQCLPTLLRHSPLGQPEAFTRQIEELYLEACSKKGIEATPHREQPAAPPLAEPDDAGLPATLEIPIAGGVKVMVPDDIERMEPYVLLEQHDWFEPEIRFIRHLMQSGMTAIDMGAGYGCYALTMGQLVGETGRVWALEPDPEKADYLQRSIRANGLTHVDVSRGEGAGSISAVLEGSDRDDIDVIRIGPNVGIDSLEGIERGSPLLMFPAESGDTAGTGLIDQLRDAGYGIYTLLPGPLVLHPWGGQDLDPFQRNLFACKDDRAERLTEAQLLVPGIPDQALAIDETWQTYLAPLPYARRLYDRWRRGAGNGDHDTWHDNARAIGAFAAAFNPSNPPSVRLQALQASFLLLNALLEKEATVTRLMSMVRIASELGHRQVAVALLNEIARNFEEHPNFHPDEPFLAVSARAATIDPGESIGEWAWGQVLAERERLQGFSSYVNGTASLPALEAIQALQYPDAEMARRQQLIKLRQQAQAPGNTVEESIAAPSASLAKVQGRPKYSIVIPTRERHDVLKFAIQSVLTQAHDDYEIVVMDNCSSMETAETVRAFGNPRIQYFKAPERLSMSDNWELALSHARGEYVFFLGDDDALMPDALKRCDHLIEMHKAKIVSWEKPTYWWPSAIVPYHRNRLYLRLTYATHEYSSKEKLKEFTQYRISFDKLPMIYSSFVHRDIIAKVIDTSGRYFLTRAPDICSGIVNAYFSDRYVFSERGLSLSGNSGHSTGTSFMYSNLNNKAMKMADDEIGEAANQHSHPSLIPSFNLSIGVANEFFIIKEKLFPDEQGLDIAPTNIIQHMIFNINNIPDKYEEALTDIEKMAKKHNISFDSTVIPAKQTKNLSPYQGLFSNSEEELVNPGVAINGDDAGIQDAAHAARLVKSMLPN